MTWSLQHSYDHPKTGETNHSSFTLSISSTSSTSLDSIETWLSRIDTLPPSPGIKRKRSASLDPSITLPKSTRLTHIGLKQWTNMMSGQCNDNEQRVDQEGSNDPGNDDATSSQSPAIRILKDSNSVKLAMEEHGILQQKAGALDRYPDFKEEMKDMVLKDRRSAMKEKEVREFQNTLAQVERLNEDTILQNLVPLIIRRKYMSEKDLEGEELKALNTKLADAKTDEERMELRKKYLFTNKLWSDDGLLVTMDSEFLRTYLPNKFNDLGFEAALATVLAKQHGMKNPKPDYCYGLTPDTFPIPLDVVLTAETRELIQVANGVYQAFLLIEGKADRGELAHAQNQAARGGATLVKASRRLYEKSGDPGVTGADTRTAIFSVAMNQIVIEIWLHWAEVTTAKIGKENIVVYHSHKLFTRALAEADQLVETRRMLHNILNWGCNTRKSGLLKLHERLCAVEGRELKKLQEENARKQDPSNKKRRKSDGRGGSAASKA